MNRTKHSVKAATEKIIIKKKINKSNPFKIDLSVSVKLSRTGPHEPCTSGGPGTRFAPKTHSRHQVKAPFPQGLELPWASFAVFNQG